VVCAELPLAPLELAAELVRGSRHHRHPRGLRARPPRARRAPARDEALPLAADEQVGDTRARALARPSPPRPTSHRPTRVSSREALPLEFVAFREKPRVKRRGRGCTSRGDCAWRWRLWARSSWRCAPPRRRRTRRRGAGAPIVTGGLPLGGAGGGGHLLAMPLRRLTQLEAGKLVAAAELRASASRAARAGPRARAFPPRATPRSRAPRAASPCDVHPRSEIGRLSALLAGEAVLTGALVSEQREMRARFGSERRTRIRGEAREVSDAGAPVRRRALDPLGGGGATRAAARAAAVARRRSRSSSCATAPPQPPSPPPSWRRRRHRGRARAGAPAHRRRSPRAPLR
jgi:hypothetical protein